MTSSIEPGELAGILTRVPFLAELSSEERERLAEAGRVEAFPANSILFSEGDEGDELYVILRGGVEVVRGEMVIAEFSEGAYFGEMAVVDGQPRSATVRTRSDCELFRLGRSAFVEQLLSSRNVLVRVMKGLSERMRKTTQRVYETELLNQRIESESRIAKLRAVSEMVAGVAHEVNGPLGVIRQAASYACDQIKGEALAGETLSEEGREELADVADACQLILSNAERANTLIRSFKNLSAREVTGALETTDIFAVIDEALGLLRINARRRGMQLVLENRCAGEHADTTWVGYPGHLEQILLNLVFNAERYAYPEGGGKVWVTLDADEAQFNIVVRDAGEGISKAHCQRIFEPFFTTGRGHGGTGLGLAIVHNLVTSGLQGKIVVESSPGVGTKFRICVPRVIRHESQA